MPICAVHKTFVDYFCENMEELSMPVPKTWFAGTKDLLTYVGTIALTIEKLGKDAKFMDIMFRRPVPTNVMAMVGSMYASAYLSCCAGSLYVAAFMSGHQCASLSPYVRRRIANMQAQKSAEAVIQFAKDNDVHHPAIEEIIHGNPGLYDPNQLSRQLTFVRLAS